MALLSRRNLLLLPPSLAACGALPADGATATTARAEDFAPANHWALDLITDLTKRGWYGGWPFEGKKAIRWRRIAEIAAVVAESIEDLTGAGIARSAWNSPTKRGTPSNIRRLAQEVEPELRALGYWSPSFENRLEFADHFWKTLRPTGVKTPYAPPPEISDPVAWEAGREIAAGEFLEGKAELWTWNTSPKMPGRFPHAIPLRQMGERQPDTRFRRTLAGHNWEIWGRMLTETNRYPDLSWLSEVSDLPGAWKRRGKESLRLDDQHPGTILPGPINNRFEERKLVWLAENESRREITSSLGVGSDGRLRRPVYQRPPDRELLWEVDDRGTMQGIGDRGRIPDARRLEILWGIEGAGVFLLRVREPKDELLPHRIYAVDLRTGEILNAAAAP